MFLQFLASVSADKLLLPHTLSVSFLRVVLDLYVVCHFPGYSRWREGRVSGLFGALENGPLSSKIHVPQT